jgi:hypothetical protein
MLMNYKVVPAIITALSIAMLGTTIMISYGAFRAEATKSGTSMDWCYISAFPEDRSVCFPNHEECNKGQSSDIFRSRYVFQEVLLILMDVYMIRM